MLRRKRFDRGRQLALALSQQLHVLEQPGAPILQARDFGIEFGALGAQGHFQRFATLSLPIGEIRLELRHAGGSAPLQLADRLAAEILS